MLHVIATHHVVQYEVNLDIEEHGNDGAPNDAVASYGTVFQC